jgi:small subunit ribosomal protein S9
MADEEQGVPADAEESQEQPAAEEPQQQPAAEEQPAAQEQPAAEEQPAPQEQPKAEEAPAAEAPAEVAPAAEAPAGEAPAGEAPAEEAPAPAAEAPAEAAPAAEVADGGDEQTQEPAKPREKPAVPGAHLEVDIVPEGADPLGREEEYADPYAVEEGEPAAAVDEEDGEEALAQPISTAAIDLASGARYRATGKRKTAIARVTLRPGSGTYLINGRQLEEHFPRTTLQRNIRQPLETVGYQDRMDVVARLHGGGISAQAGALRHGVSRALLEADPNLRGELKRRGFLTRDSRAKERKKAGLKKARKRPQFSKR